MEYILVGLTLAVVAASLAMLALKSRNILTSLCCIVVMVVVVDVAAGVEVRTGSLTAIQALTAASVGAMVGAALGIFLLMVLHRLQLK